MRPPFGEALSPDEAVLLFGADYIYRLGLRQLATACVHSPYLRQSQLPGGGKLKGAVFNAEFRFHSWQLEERQNVGKLAPPPTERMTDLGGAPRPTE